MSVDGEVQAVAVAVTEEGVKPKGDTGPKSSKDNPKRSLGEGMTLGVR